MIIIGEIDTDDEMSYILNPKTNRMIKVGGKPWRDLVKQGLVPYDDSVRDHSEMEAKKPLREKDARPAARKKYKKRATQNEIANYTAQCASRTLHKHIDALSSRLENVYQQGDPDEKELSEFEDNLKNLIMEEMLTGEATTEPTKYVRKPPKKRQPEQRPAQFQEPIMADQEEYYLASDESDTELIGEVEDSD